MRQAGVLIIGAGQGGVQAAISLRQEGYSGPIKLIGDEDTLPYQRPPLSKAYLKTGEAEKLVLRPSSFFEANDIELLAGKRAEEIDRVNRCVHVNGSTHPYDHLILATGTRNAIPKLPGISSALGLRNLADAQALRAALNSPRRIAIIGGGFIGLEFAAVARSLGHEVKLAEAAPRLMARAVSAQISESFRIKHEDLGVELYLSCAAKEVTPNGVALTDGRMLHADLILLAAGVVPNVELAAEAGLAVENGIVVDGNLRTSDPAIHALGDCAAFPDIRSGTMVRLESVQAATDHARSIARFISKGDAGPYNALAWFWSDQADWKLQIAGLAAPTDDTLVLDDRTVLRFAGERLTAVETINNAKVHMLGRRLLSRDEVPTRSELQAAGNDLSRC